MADVKRWIEQNDEDILRFSFACIFGSLAGLFLCIPIGLAFSPEVAFLIMDFFFYVGSFGFIFFFAILILAKLVKCD